MKLFSIMQTAFDNFDSTVRQYLSKTFNNLGLQYSHSQIFGVIFDGIKGIMQNIMFYIEDAFTEQNVFTAVRKKSIFSLAKLSGYEPYYGTAASGTVNAVISISNPLSNNNTKIFMANKIQIINNMTGVTYSADLPTDYYAIDLSKPLVKYNFKIVQGSYSKATYTALGESFETIHIDSATLFDKEYVTVKVDNVEWSRADNFYDMSDNGEEYVLSCGYDNSFDIMFGNSVHGKQLNEGQTVIVDFLVHNGTSGNILPNEKTSFRFLDSGVDSLGNSVSLNDYVTLNVETCISGGTESDTVEFVRSMIGKNSRSLVLASRDNFELFFKRFSFIGYINCWSEENSAEINVTALRNYKDYVTSTDDYFSISSSDLLLTDDQKSMIENTLANSQRVFAGVSIKFIDPVIRKYAFICYVKPDNIYNKEIITQGIKKSIGEYFMSLADNQKFIAKSDIISTVLKENENIVSLTIDIISDLAESAYAKGYYEKHVQKLMNGSYRYVTEKVMYESGSEPGLDNYGNISLDSSLEVPFVSSVKYYEKDSEYKNLKDCIRLDPVKVIFI